MSVPTESSIDEADSASVQRNAVRGSVVAIADNLVRAVLGIGTTLLVAAHVSKEDFGLISIALAVETVLIVLRNGGFAGALIQRKDLQEIHINSVFWIGIILSVVLVFGLWCIAEPLAAFYENTKLVSVLKVLTISIIALGFSGVPEALLRRRLQFGRLMAVNSGSAVVGSATAIVAAVMGAGVWALALRIVVARLLVALISWFVCDWRPRRQIDFKGVGELLTFGGYLFLAALMTFAKDRLDGPIIGKLIGIEAAGLFFMARNLALSIMQQVCGALGQVMFAAFSAVQTDESALRSGYLTGTRCLSVLVFPLVACIVATSPEAVPLILGDKWEGLTALIQVVSLQGITICLGVGISPVLLSVGRSRALLALTMIRAGIAVGAFGIGCRWGVLGVAIAWTVAVFLWAPVELRLVCRQLGLKFDVAISNICGPLLAATVAALTVRGLVSCMIGTDPFTMVMLELVAGALVYSVLTLVFERNTLQKLRGDLGRSFGAVS